MNKKRTYKHFIKVAVFTATLFFLFPVFIVSQEVNKADSLINKLLDYRNSYGNYIQSYDAQLYIKGSSFVKKKNFLFRLAPDNLSWDKKGNDNFLEALIDVHFDSPNYYSQKIEAINGTDPAIKNLHERLMQFVNVNIYDATVFDGKVFLTSRDNIHKYYRFEYVSNIDTLGHLIHKVEIIPVIKSQKLLKGHIYIIDGLSTICGIDVSGVSEYVKYRVETEYGLPGDNFLLPVVTKLSFDMSLLGNRIIDEYHSYYNYTSIEQSKDSIEHQKIQYDLSEYFLIQTDSLPVNRDSLFWKEKRPVPLNQAEQQLFNETSSSHKAAEESLSNKKWYLSQGLIIPTMFETNNTQFSYSGLLNPLELSYSKDEGLKYYQQFQARKQFANGMQLQFKPNIAYIFKYKEFYFDTPISLLYAPDKLGELTLSFGNRNQTYSNAVIRQIEENIPDTINFEDFNLKYYKHYNMKLFAGYEITNGLLLNAGINYDWYNPVKKAKSDEQQEPSPALKTPAIDEDIKDIVSDKYRSFSPMIKLYYTPEQYYRIKGKKKEYIGSHWPTISLAYTRGIKGILGSNSEYGRIEADIQQRIPIGLLRSFQYYMGIGKFSNKESTYFTNFGNFRRWNFPKSWKDPIGGVFHLLDNHYYAASNNYAQVHLMYESPFFFLAFFPRISKDILMERVYLSQLHTPILPSYTELGYGFGNYIGNIGFFISLKKLKYQSFGIQASFQLGK